LSYPRILEGEGTVLKLINSGGHSAPLAKMKCKEEIFIFLRLEECLKDKNRI